MWAQEKGTRIPDLRTAIPFVATACGSVQSTVILRTTTLIPGLSRPGCTRATGQSRREADLIASQHAGNQARSSRIGRSSDSVALAGSGQDCYVRLVRRRAAGLRRGRLAGRAASVRVALCVR